MASSSSSSSLSVSSVSLHHNSGGGGGGGGGDDDDDGSADRPLPHAKRICSDRAGGSGGSDDDDDIVDDMVASSSVELGQPFAWFIQPDKTMATFDHTQPRTASTYRTSMAGRPLDEGLFRTLARYNRIVDGREQWPMRRQVYAVSMARSKQCFDATVALLPNCPLDWLPNEVIIDYIVPYLLVCDLSALVCTNVRLYLLLRNVLHERILSVPYMHPSLLSHDLLHMIDVVLNRRQSLFLTGEAGSGKTTLLSQFVQYATLFGRVDVLCVAPTGLAAKHLDGTTIHSALRLGYGEVTHATPGKCVELIQQSQRNVVLVVDEVSMCTAAMFDFMAATLHISTTSGHYHTSDARPTELGYGMIVACGDFAQLPPIVKKKPTRTNAAASSLSSSSSASSSSSSTPVYAFQSQTWTRLFGQHPHNVLYLKRQHRQRNDPRYVELLRRVRDGCVTSADTEALSTRCVTVAKSSSTQAEAGHRGTLLCTRNELVNRVNAQYLEQLSTPQYVLPACERGTTPFMSMDSTRSTSTTTAAAAAAAANTAASSSDNASAYALPEGALKIKVGARVLLTANHRTRGTFYNPLASIGERESDGVRVPNGSAGVVVEMVHNRARFAQLVRQYGVLDSAATAQHHLVDMYHGISERNLRLRAYHTERIHHLSREYVVDDIRVLTDNPDLADLAESKKHLDASVKAKWALCGGRLSDNVLARALHEEMEEYEFFRNVALAERTNQVLCVGSMIVTAVPLVHFDDPPVTALIMPYVERRFRYETLSNYAIPAHRLRTHKLVKLVEHVRMAFPLRVARAVTAHKAQGATLRHATVDMHGMFEYGHPYVMLSRVPSLSELWLHHSNTRIVPSTINRLADPVVTAYYAQLINKSTTQAMFGHPVLPPSRPRCDEATTMMTTDDANQEP